MSYETKVMKYDFKVRSGPEETIRSIHFPKDTLIQAFQLAFEKSRETTETLMNEIKIIKEQELATMRSPKSQIMLHPKESTNIICQGNTEILNNNTKVIFIPDERKLWFQGQEMRESFLVTKGKVFKIKVEVYNFTEHPITLFRRTPLKSFIPF